MGCYEVLDRSSRRWHEGRHDFTPWLNHFLAIVRRAGAEFGQLAGQVEAPRANATAI